MESPYKDSWPGVCVCVCVCVCVWVWVWVCVGVCLYFCVLLIYYNAKNIFLITAIIYWREIYKINLGNLLFLCEIYPNVQNSNIKMYLMYLIKILHYSNANKIFFALQ